MIRKLIPDGDHYRIEIPLELVQAINATVDTEFEVKLVGPSIILTPITGDSREHRLNESLEKINERYGDDLKKLDD